MKKPPPQSKKKNAFSLLLIFIIVLLGAFSYKKSSDYNKLDAIFIQEKSALKLELDEIIEDYKDLSIKRKDLSKRLIKEVNKIIVLRDSVKKLSSSNYKVISRYRRKIATLERQNRRLFFKVDSLSIANKVLKEENEVVSENLTEKQIQAQNLTKANEELKETQKELKAKVAVAGIIKTSPISVTTMKERSSGKLTTTSRSSRTDAFKVRFKMLKNTLAEKGNKEIYIQITDENKKVIAPKGTVTLKNGNKIAYSQTLIADYYKEDLDVLSLVFVNRDDINRGIYTVSTFVDGNFTGAATAKVR